MKNGIISKIIVKKGYINLIFLGNGSYPKSPGSFTPSSPTTSSQTNHDVFNTDTVLW